MGVVQVEVEKQYDKKENEKKKKLGKKLSSGSFGNKRDAWYTVCYGTWVLENGEK